MQTAIKSLLQPPSHAGTIRSVIASPRTKGKGGSYPLILPPGSKVCCEAIAQSSTPVWREVPFSPTGWLSVLLVQKEQRGAVQAWDSGAGSISVFHSRRPQLVGDVTGVSRRVGTGGVGSLPAAAVVVVVPVGFLCPRSGWKNPYQRSSSTPASLVVCPVYQAGASTCAPMLSASNP